MRLGRRSRSVPPPPGCRSDNSHRHLWPDHTRPVRAAVARHVPGHASVSYPSERTRQRIGKAPTLRRPRERLISWQPSCKCQGAGFGARSGTRQSKSGQLIFDFDTTGYGPRVIAASGPWHNFDGGPARRPRRPQRSPFYSAVLRPTHSLAALRWSVLSVRLAQLRRLSAVFGSRRVHVWPLTFAVLNLFRKSPEGEGVSRWSTVRRESNSLFPAL